MIKKIFLIVFSLLIISLSTCSAKNDTQNPSNIESAKETLHDLNITIYDLIEANRMSVLLNDNETVRIEQSIDESSSTDDYILYNNQIVNIYTSYYQGEMISKTFSYDVFYAHLIDGLVEASVYVEHLIGLSPLIEHDSVLSQHFENAEITLIESNDTTLSLNVEPYENYSFKVIVDRKTLAIQSIQFDSEGINILKCTYQIPLASETLLKDLQGPSKQVEFSADIYNENYSIHLSKIIDAPANWEVIPSCFDLHELYTDSSCTVHYSYPGDGIDYSVYLTNARG